MYCTFPPATLAEQRLLQTEKATPNRIQSLAVALTAGSDLIMTNLVASIVAIPKPTLTSLRINSGQQHAAVFNPLASIITSLFVPNIVTEEGITAMAEILKHTTSLSFLELTSNDEMPTSTFLSLMLTSLHYQLQHLALQSSTYYFDSDALKVLRDLIADAVVLGSLVSINFCGITLARLEKTVGWREAEKLLRRNGTKIITRSED